MHQRLLWIASSPTGIKLRMGSNVGLTLARMTDYYRDIVNVLTMIEQDCVK